MTLRVRVPPWILMYNSVQILPLTNKQIERFWAKVQIRRWNQCWYWQGKNSRYGCAWIHGHVIGAHRVAYAIATGKDPGELMVCHSCDDKLCVNPRHLWLGTHEDNMADMDIKGRRRQPDQRGEKNNSSRLTRKQVNQIRKLYTTKKYTFMQLASRFNVSYVTIHHIVTRKTWK